MARSKRSDVFQDDEIGVYHCFNRIVRRSFLCGVDPHTGIDYSHRRDWMLRRLKYLAEHFSIDVLAYAILSNHYHLVLRNRPDQVDAMSDRDVVVAWLMICPKTQKNADGTALQPTEPEIRAELSLPGRVDELRHRLSNPSWMIRQLAQYMGIRCNAEDKLCGHFWESRFGMRRLCDEAAVLACLAYVDLNPIRAHLTDSLEGYRQVSIGERLRTLDDETIDSSNWLSPIALADETDGKSVTVVNRLSREELSEMVAATPRPPMGCLPIRFDQYVELLRWLSGLQGPSDGDRGSDQDARSDGVSILQQLYLDPSEFADLVNHFGDRFFTAAGGPESLRREAARRGRRRINAPGRQALSRRGPKRVIA
jgi:hypothetical protein